MLPPVDFALLLAAAGASCSVFHAPQAGHFPAHLAVSFPHSVQKYTVFAFKTSHLR
jgi:hypothetical protein